MAKAIRTLESVSKFVRRFSCSVFGTTFKVRVERDCKNKKSGRIFIQLQYHAPCTKTGQDLPWNGRKFYLSDHMTNDEIAKTVYVAFESAVKHEVMEGFKYKGVIVFNPHINFTELIKISHLEIKRKNHPNVTKR